MYVGVGRLAAVLGLIVLAVVVPAAAVESGVIRVGDVILILEPGQAVSNGQRVRVAARGTITLPPPIGDIEVAGLSVEQLDRVLRSRGKLVEVVTRWSETSPGVIEVLRPGRPPERRSLDPPIQRDPVRLCPACG